MKKILFALATVMLLPVYAMAQDQLITEDGDVITAWEVEIASSKIFYKPSKDSEDSKSIAKSKVLMWKKADGTKVRIGESAAATQTQPAATTTAAAGKLGVISDAMKTQNAQMVSDFNKGATTSDSKEHSGSRLYNFWAKDGTIFENDEIKVSPKFVCCYSKTNKPEDQIIISSTPQFSGGTAWVSPYKGKGWCVTVYNKTDQNLYVDQANSFFVLNTQSSAYYVPKSTGQEHSATTGVGVGLGFIGVGASNGNSTSQTTFTQRIVTIPPMSSKDLDIIYWDKDKLTNFYSALCPYLVEKKNLEVKNNAYYGVLTVDIPVGKAIEIESPSPVTINNIICYSTDENFSTKGFLRQAYELREVLGMDSYEHSKKETEHFNSSEVQLPLTIGIMRENCIRPLLKELKDKK